MPGTPGSRSAPRSSRGSAVASSSASHGPPAGRSAVTVSSASWGGGRGAPAPLQVLGRDCVAPAREIHQELVVQAGRLQHRLQAGMALGVMREHLQHRRVLVAQQKLDGAVLQRLEARRGPQQVAETHVFRGRQRLQHRPLLGQLAHHLLGAGQHLAALPDLVALEETDGGAKLVDHQLHPQLRDLVLHDEQHLVVVRRIGDRVLRGQQAVQLQVAAVAHAAGKVGVDARFQRALVLFYGHPSINWGTALGAARAPA